MSKRSVAIHASLRYDSSSLEDAQMATTALLAQLHVEAEKVDADPLWNTLTVETEEHEEESRSIWEYGATPHEWKMLKASVQATCEVRSPNLRPTPVIDHWMDYQ